MLLLCVLVCFNKVLNCFNLLIYLSRNRLTFPSIFSLDLIEVSELLWFCVIRHTSSARVRYSILVSAHIAVELQYMEVMTCVTSSCDKIQTLFIFRAIWENTAHVQKIRCLPKHAKGSHLIHWTSAVFSHIALK